MAVRTFLSRLSVVYNNHDFGGSTGFWYYASHPSGRSLKNRNSNPIVTPLELNKTKSGLDFGGNLHATLGSLRYMPLRYHCVTRTIEALAMMSLPSAPPLPPSQF